MADLVERSARAFVGAWTWLASVLPTGVHDQRDGVVVAATGLPDPTLNPAYVVREPAAPEPSLRWAVELRRERGAPSTGFDLPDGRHPSVEATLAQLGFHRLVTRPGMSVEAGALRRRPTPDRLTVRPVRTREDWAAYVDVQVAVFGLAPTVAAEFPPYRLVGDARMELLVGDVQGEITCTAAVFVTGADAAIYAVATQAAHRGRGHGTAITSAAVDVAVQRGADVVSLQSSADGFPLYRALGFVESGPWVVWVDPAVEPPVSD